MKALCIGSSLIEITSQIKENIKEEEVKKLEDNIICGGGHAGNIAYLLGKWGMETYISSMLGADDNANKIKKEFETIGVKTDYIETTFDKTTSISLVLVNTINKNKTVLEVANNTFLKKFAYGIDTDVVVSDGNDFNATVAAFDKYPKAIKFIVVHINNYETNELAKFANYLIFNKETAESFTKAKIDYNDSSTLVNVYNKLKQKYPKSEIIVTLGERGSIYSINAQVKIMPTVKMNIVDTNGAGDAFAGAFIYGIARNFGLEKSIAYATISGALSTTKLTSRQSIPALIEVSNYYDSKFGAQNNPNNTNNPGNKTNNSDNLNNNTETNTVTNESAQNSTQTPKIEDNRINNAGDNAINMNTTNEEVKELNMPNDNK